MQSRELRQMRARIAIHTRLNPDSPELVDERRAFRALRLEERLREELAVEPVLTTAQRQRLATVLLDERTEEADTA